jgi:hypothetical protein
LDRNLMSEGKERGMSKTGGMFKYKDEPEWSRQEGNVIEMGQKSFLLQRAERFVVFRLSIMWLVALVCRYHHRIIFTGAELSPALFTCHFNKEKTCKLLVSLGYCDWYLAARILIWNIFPLCSMIA